MRKLASIRQIKDIIPIPYAETIEIARIDGWDVIVKKGVFEVGDLCMFFEADSIIPRAEWSESLFVNYDALTLTIRPKMILGILSQGLVMPLEPFGEFIAELHKDLPPGTNVNLDEINFTNILGIEKFTVEYDSNYIIGRKPMHLASTTIDRIQNYDESILADCAENTTKVFEKLDGETIIIYIEDNCLHCCSNSVELDTRSDHPFCKWLKKHGPDILLYFFLDKKIKPDEGAALYGEFYANNVYFFMESDLDGNVTFPTEKLKFSVLKTVPEISLNKIPSTRDGWLALADGPSQITGGLREGLVVWQNNRIIFKAISNQYLIKS